MLLLSRLDREENAAEAFLGGAAIKGAEGWNGGSAQSRERLQRDGFNDTKYKIVLTLDRLKAP